MKRASSSSHNLNKPTPPLPEKIVFDDIHKSVKKDTAANKVKPVEPVPMTQSPFRITSLIRKFTLLFILYSVIAHLTCHVPITEESSDLCQRHQSTIDYFEPLYAEHVQPVLQPHLDHAHEKLAPVTKQLRRLQPRVHKATHAAHSVYAKNIHPRLEIQYKRLVSKYGPVVERYTNMISEKYNTHYNSLHSQYYEPVLEHEHTQRVIVLSNDSQQWLLEQYATVQPHLRIVALYSQRQLARSSATVWSYTKQYYPHVHAFTTKYSKRVVAECLAVSRKATAYMSRIALGQYVKLGLDDKLVNVHHFKHLKIKFLDPVLTRLGEWVDQQRSNTATIYSESVENIDDLSQFIKNMGEVHETTVTGGVVNDEAAAPESTTAAEAVVEEKVDPALKLQMALVSLNESHATLSQLLDDASVSFTHQLKSQRDEDAAQITHSAKLAVDAITRDFERLVEGFEEYHEKELAGVIDSAEGDADAHTTATATANIGSVRVKVINKLRSIAQESLDHLVRWQNEIDSKEVELLEDSLKNAYDHLIHTQRTVGTTFAWTDGITYVDWQRYHDLGRLYEDQVEELHSLQEHDDVVEPLFDALFRSLMELEKTFEEKVELVGKVSVSASVVEEDVQEQDNAQIQSNAPLTPDAVADVFEDDSGEEEVNDSTQKEFEERGETLHDDEQDANVDDGDKPLNGTIYDVPDHETSSVESSDSSASASASTATAAATATDMASDIPTHTPPAHVHHEL